MFAMHISKIANLHRVSNIGQQGIYAKSFFLHIFTLNNCG